MFKEIRGELTKAKSWNEKKKNQQKTADAHSQSRGKTKDKRADLRKDELPEDGEASKGKICQQVSNCDPGKARLKIS